MKKIKFFAALLGCGIMLTTAASAFTDMPTDADLSQALNNAVANGILSGYDDDTIRSDNYITRAEMASIITRACGAAAEGDLSEFHDVPTDAWYYSAMAKAYKMKAFSGDDNKYMHPTDNITFQECFTVLSMVFDLLPSYQKNIYEEPESLTETQVFVASSRRVYDVSCLFNYADGADVAIWARPFYAGVITNGGWNGENGYLTPTSYIKRGQFAMVMNNLIQNYIDTPGTYTELPAGNTMIRCDDVILDGVTTPYDIYIADCVGFQKLAVNNVNIKRLVVRGCATPLDENNEVITKDSGITVTGTFDQIRVLVEYITISAIDAEYNSIYTVSNTNAYIGQVTF